MKIIAVFAAGALAAGTLAAVPADAQRYGWHGDRGHGWHGDRGRGWRGDRGYGRRWDGYRGYRGYRGDYGYRGGYGRTRVVCRIQRGYYGPVRRCFSVYR